MGPQWDPRKTGKLAQRTLIGFQWDPTETEKRGPKNLEKQENCDTRRQWDPSGTLK